MYYEICVCVYDPEDDYNITSSASLWNKEKD